MTKLMWTFQALHIAMQDVSWTFYMWYELVTVMLFLNKYCFPTNVITSVHCESV